MEKFQRIAAYGVIREEGKILLCRISEQLPHRKGYWTLPGGGIDFGEPPEKAMIREVMEETGYIVESKGILGISNLYGASEGKEFHAVRIVYEAEIVGGALTSERDGTTDRSEWILAQQVEDFPLVELVEDALELIKRGDAEQVGGGDATR